MIHNNPKSWDAIARAVTLLEDKLTRERVTEVNDITIASWFDVVGDVVIVASTTATVHVAGARVRLGE